MDRVPFGTPINEDSCQVTGERVQGYAAQSDQWVRTAFNGKTGYVALAWLTNRDRSSPGFFDCD